MVLYYCDLLCGLHRSSLCFATTTFQGMVLPSSSGETYSVGVRSIELTTRCYNQKLCTHMQGRLLFIALSVGGPTKQTTRPIVIELNAPLSKRHKLCLITSENKIHNKLRVNKQFQHTKLISGSSATQQTNRINIL
jgi:hypothetical protein